MDRENPTEAALSRLAKAELLSAEAQRIAGVGTWQFDAATEIVTWSTEMFRIFGVSPATFAPSQKAFLACVHPDDREEMLAVIGDTIAGTPMDFVHRVVRPDGEVRHVHGRAQVVVLEKNGAPVLVGTAQDITEQRRSEEIIAAQTAQLRDMQAELIYLARQSAMGTMAATLAHELNQPLAAISNYAAGLKRLSHDNRAREGLKQIESNIERAGQIIRHLRNMTTRGSTSFGRADLAEIIKDAVALVSKGACGENELEYRAQVGTFVEADPIQIGQVIINLVKNACEAMEGRPAKKIRIEAQTLRDVVRVAVVDSGPGIHPELLDTIFDGKPSTKPDGMGIGLSISRTIVETHGGQIGAENMDGGGACFWFTLPLAPATTPINGPSDRD